MKVIKKEKQIEFNVKCPAIGWEDVDIPFEEIIKKIIPQLKKEEKIWIEKSFKGEYKKGFVDYLEERI